jgi:hypothetical protein
MQQLWLSAQVADRLQRRWIQAEALPWHHRQPAAL